MSGFALRPGSVLVLRLALVAGVAALLAGCADSERLSDPFSNPFRASAQPYDPATTSTVSPNGPIQSRPLPPPEYRTSRPSPEYVAPSHPNPSLASSQSVPPDTTSSVSRGQSNLGWTAEGGTPIVVAQGESVEIIARRYGIPSDALLRTNGFSSSSQVRPGTRLIIPIYNAALAASSGARFAKGTKPNEKLVFVKGPKPAEKEMIKAAKAEEMKRDAKKGDTKKADSEKTTVAKKDKHEKDAKSEVAKRDEHKPDAKVKTADISKDAVKESVKPGDSKSVVAKSVVTKTDVPASEPKKTVDTTTTASLPADTPEFRWPAHGRIVQCFKCNGNDGINIALPEGTSVKAAEAGTVVYAGSEVKGFGNLVLIRHPNGFVTAYANNGEIDVKRGESVKRGQVIAKSGQTGNVATPQLHFEVRKGSTPVDPTQYLAGL